jgi:DNA polymerase-1
VTLPDLSRFEKVALDCETTGLGFRDRPVGLSWATPDGQSGYAAWGHQVGGSDGLFDAPLDANNCSLAEVKEWSARELRPDLTVIAHNAPFDLRQLAYVGIRPRSRIEDTLVCAPLLNELEPSFSLDALAVKYLGRTKSDDELNRWCAQRFGGQATRKAQAGNYWRAPGAVVAPYARGDAELTLALYDTLRPKITAEGLEQVYALETAIIPIVVQMHLTGTRVDVTRAHELDAELTERIDRLRETWDLLTGGADPAKTKDVAAAMRRAGIAVGRTAPTARFPEGQDSVTSEDLVHVKHPVAQTLVELRKLSKFRDVFVRTYVLSNADESGVVHPEFHALRSDDFGSVAGRFSSGSSDGSLNLQNIPKRDKEWGHHIRGLFVPYHAGWRWLKADYSQLQFRLLAHYAALIGYPALADTYRDAPEWALNADGEVDFHTFTAHLTSTPRDQAKNINFGLVFGMGKKKLARSLGVSEAEGERILDQYHSALPAVRATYDRLAERVNQKGQIRTLGGRLRRFLSAADAKAKGWTVRDSENYVGSHKGLNALLQGGEGDMMKTAMVALTPVCREFDVPLHLTVHDELDFSVPADVGPRFAARVREVMEDHHLRVPIVADVTCGADWGHAGEPVAAIAEAA